MGRSESSFSESGKGISNDDTKKRPADVPARSDSDSERGRGLAEDRAGDSFGASSSPGERSEASLDGEALPGRGRLRFVPASYDDRDHRRGESETARETALKRLPVTRRQFDRIIETGPTGGSGVYTNGDRSSRRRRPTSRSESGSRRRRRETVTQSGSRGKPKQTAKLASLIATSGRFRQSGTGIARRKRRALSASFARRISPRRSISIGPPIISK